MLLDIGVEYVILGHSERRMYFGECDRDVNQKAKTALSKGLKPIICCGESEDQENPMEFVASQIVAAYQGISAEAASESLIAYEPIWAIGTGKTATPDVAQKMISHLRNTLRELYGSTADYIRILYGGSVKASNIASFLSRADIDGALVGGASLEADSFVEMVKNSK